MEKMRKLKKAQDAEQEKGLMKTLNSVAKKMPGPVVMVLGICGIGKVKKQDDVDPISYKKLRKDIGKKHPVDPLTLEKFETEDSICVYNYSLKLIDACFCIAIYNFFRKFRKKSIEICLKKKRKDIEKPESMKDVPDSGSDSEDNLDSF